MPRNFPDGLPVILGNVASRFSTISSLRSTQGLKHLVARIVGKRFFLHEMLNLAGRSMSW